MKRILPLILLISFAGRSLATQTFTLITSVCDTNGVLVVQYTGFSLPPFHYHWSYGARSADHIVHGFTDTLYHYNGAPLTMVTMYDSTGTQVDTGSFVGTPPLYFAVAATSAVCPALPTVTSTAYGTGPFTYVWYDLATGATVGTGATISVHGGSYGVWITDAAGCQSGSPVTGLTQVAIESTPFTFSLASTVAGCTNGTASIGTLTGVFTPPLSYLWSNGGTSDTIKGLITGTYSVTITDSSGCMVSNSINVAQSNFVGATTTVSGASCAGNDGSIICHPSGGTAPYSFLWSNGSTSVSQSSLSPGTYTVYITDANGCIGTGSGTISGSTPITVSHTVTASSCTAATGMLSLGIGGGFAPFHDTIYSTPIQTGIVATGLSAGLYNFKVTDAHGCNYNGTVTVPGADSVAIGFTGTPATCGLSNGTIYANVYNGPSPYTYSWNTGASSSSLIGEPSGTYTVTVIDGYGCTASAIGMIDQYSSVSLAVSSTPASCLFSSNGVVTVAASGGTPPYTYHWSNGGTTPSLTLMRTGPFWVTVTDHSGCSASAYDYLGYNLLDSNCFCKIKGVIYHDVNVDCTREASEPGIPNVQVYCSGIGYTYTDDSGRYTFLVPTGTYTVTETIQTYYPLAGCQPNNIVVGVIADSGCEHEVDFANLYDTLHDVQISTWDYTQPVAGMPYQQITVIHNSGSSTENSPVAGAMTDPQLDNAFFVPSGVYGYSPVYDYQTFDGGGLAPMAPGTSQTFIRSFNVPGYLSVGTSLVFKDTVSYIAPLNSWITDYIPWNNVNTFNTQTVLVTSPNFKEVSPKGVGTGGMISVDDSNMRYMIHFQNTGSNTAENVVVIDTLDANLNWSSFTPVFESAPCTITQSANGQIVKFTFENIHLQSSSVSAAASNGMATYNIKLKTGLAYGDQIRNNASIYFDNNAPAKTNTTLNTIGWVLKAETLTPSSSESLKLYPNPAFNSVVAVVSADQQGVGEMTITDITGRVLLEKAINLVVGSQQVSADISRFSNGIYLVTVRGADFASTAKLNVVH